MQAQVGRYQIVGELGRGGMGVVYRALDPSSGREVALKALPALADPEERLRFVREAETAREIDHPNVLAVLELGEERGRPYLVTELAPGGSLADRLRLAPLAPEEAARVVAQVARGLAAAHERGALHRDLKPGNVLFAADGRALLADFGLARRVRDETLTATGTVLGTPGYMSPEQAQGARADERSDVYGLGSLLYAALSGGPPFRGRSVLETLTRVVGEPAPIPPHASAELAAVVARCLAKEPRERYASAAQVAAALDRCAMGERAVQRPRIHAFLVGLLLIGLAAFALAPPPAPRVARSPAAPTPSDTDTDADTAPLESAGASLQLLYVSPLPVDDSHLLDRVLAPEAIASLRREVEAQEVPDPLGNSPALYVDLARLALAERAPLRARALAEQAIARDEAYGPAYRVRGETFATEANTQRPTPDARGKLCLKAEADLKQALKLDPLDWQALRELGTIHYWLGHKARALRTYSRSLSIRPTATVLYRKGHVLRELGRHQESLPLFERAHQLEPTHTGSLMNLVALAEGAQEFERAAGYQRMLCDLLPEDADELERLFTHLGRLRRFEQLVTYAPRAAKFPKRSWLAVSLARAYLELDQLPEARAALDRAISLAPSDPRGLWISVRIAERTGDDELFLRSCERLLALPKPSGLSPSDRTRLQALRDKVARRLGR